MKPKLHFTYDCVMMLLALTVLVTGIILHLKAYGIVVEPRQVLKTVHYLAGFALAVFIIGHFATHAKWFVPVCERDPLYGTVFVLLIIAFLSTLGTGIVKLCAHVRGLGLWHYWLGIAMSLLVIIHVSKAFPYFLKLVGKKQ